MKRLILVRHGKSSWEHNVEDKERPLLKRAYDDARLVINSFKNFVDFEFEIFTSYANRAKSSAEIFQNELNIPDKKFHIKREIYTFDVNELKSEIERLPNSVDNVMLFGHNPAITNFVNFFGSENYENIPTTGLVVLEFNSSSWNNIQPGITRLNLFPKNLRL
ncbi:SixA phosphatase family protein [Psychroflexus aestuariivivens]|uniref:SixA phosphatase family protein n=1 Tax=Psychroflexus aestuariivivens TaxID=1795040 RepID=UPI000FDC1997|nr:histidine phosphatase family protein [Psychroflexus aestuariivivens]